MWWFWRSSKDWRGRRTFDVIWKRDPLLKRSGALGWLQQMLHTWACTWTHRLTPILCARSHLPRFSIKMPTENEWTAQELQQGLIWVCGCTQAWTDVVVCCALAEEVEDDEQQAVSGSFRSYLTGFLLTGLKGVEGSLKQLRLYVFLCCFSLKWMSLQAPSVPFSSFLISPQWLHKVFCSALSGYTATLLLICFLHHLL